MNLREQIAQTTGPVLQPVEMPEWKCTVYVRKLNFGERVKLVDQITDPANVNKLLYVWAILTAVTDETGTKVFTEDDYDLVAAKEPEAVIRLGKEAAKINGLLSDTVDEAKKD